MKLSQLIETTSDLEWSVASGSADPARIDISLVTDDSRRAVPGSIFVARTGTAVDGSAYIDDAIARGAVVVVASRGSRGGAAAPTAPAPAVPPAPASGPASRRALTATVADPARAIGVIAHALEQRPTRSLRVVGVTGTNGKTTITYLVRQLLEASGRRCGIMGTVEVHDGVRATRATLTTPGADEVARSLGAMVRNGCTAAAIEVSSHALSQSRVEGVEFAVGIFTNLTGDHLDYHGSMEAYAAAKARLFERLAPGATAIVNAMDPAHERMLRHCSAKVVRCRLDAPEAAIRAGADIGAASVRIIESSLTGMRAELEGPWGRFESWLPLPGAHNAINALQALVAAHALGIGREALEQALPSLHAPPGRLQAVTAADAPFQVLVDYAHTDDALANVLSAMRPLVEGRGRVITVFGCGGNRDRSKRPRMAAIACRLADLVFVTSDNPRREDPEAIIDEIMTGVPKADRPRVSRDADRARAIETAITAARPGDVVLIAGKGHEDYQEIGIERRHFDDREVAMEALAAAPPNALAAVRTGGCE